MSDELIKLSDDDWDILLPGTPFPLGKTVLDLRPLGVDDVKKALNMVHGLKDELFGAGITEQNYRDKDKLITLSKVVLEHAPALVELCSKVRVEDLKKLPPSKLAELIGTLIDINLKSNEDLEKNLEALAEKIQAIA